MRALLNKCNFRDILEEIMKMLRFDAINVLELLLLKKTLGDMYNQYMKDAEDSNVLIVT